MHYAVPQLRRSEPTKPITLFCDLFYLDLLYSIHTVQHMLDNNCKTYYGTTATSFVQYALSQAVKRQQIKLLKCGDGKNCEEVFCTRRQ